MAGINKLPAKGLHGQRLRTTNHIAKPVRYFALPTSPDIALALASLTAMDATARTLCKMHWCMFENAEAFNRIALDLLG
ncbi:hypothetical protein NS277_09295 [Novosphingobium barchaimii]|nr:hypothetical protein NS277_09295 [Novosphingobium barchaimii]